MYLTLFCKLCMHILAQEMLALGCSNFLGSFFKIHVICCALSVTLAVDSAGGKSQVSAVLRFQVTLTLTEIQSCV